MSDASEIRRLQQRLANLLGRGRVLLVDDSGATQQHQIDLGPQGAAGPLFVRDNTPVMGLFGFTSVPPIGADVAMIFLSGDHQRGAVIGHNHQPSRPRGLAAGDAAIYDSRGQIIKLIGTGAVIDAHGLDVTIQNAAHVTITGSTSVTVTAPTVTVNATTVNLGGTGGAAVARVGDSVSGGVITSGSSKVKAVA